MPKLALNVPLVTAAALALVSCAQPRPAGIPTAPAVIAQAAGALATVLPAATSAPFSPTESRPAAALPTAAPAVRPPEPAPSPSRSLFDLAPGETLELLREIPIARTDFGVRVAFSPVSDVLLHNGNGMRIEQFDLVRGEPLGELTGFEDFPPFTISVSPDGSAVLADDGPEIQVWLSATGEQVAALALAPFSMVINAGFLSDGLFFAVDSNGIGAIWDPGSWGEIYRFNNPGWITAAVPFPDGSALALQDTRKQEISILDLTGNRLGAVPLARAEDRLLSISPTGDRFLLHVDYGYPTEGIRIVDVASGETLLDLPMLNFRQFAVSNDWSLLAAVGVQNELRLYRLPDGQLLLAQPLEVARTLGISMSGDAAYLAFYVFKSGNAGAAIQVWGRGSDRP
ncbi:MAG TPA: WD40 repeat domain-containing protein [Anaerolineales bacterium]